MKTNSSKVVLETVLGLIVIEVNTNQAPVTAANFLKYVDLHYLDGTQFFRVVTPENQPDEDVKIRIVQGGINEDAPHKLPPIAHEGTDTTGLLHVDGAVSMARRAIGSASGSFFICIGDQPQLDAGGARTPDMFGFAAFGKIVEGMDVVHKILCRAEDTPYLSQGVEILRAYRQDRNA